MGMTVHQLFRHAVHHVVHGEVAPLRLDLGVEGDLHHHIAQLLAHVPGVIPVQGIQDLVGLLQEIAPDGAVGLLPVPGAAAGGAQQAHHFQEVLVAIMRFTLKIYHTSSAFAR